jgi:hypothetical protein
MSRAVSTEARTPRYPTVLHGTLSAAVGGSRVFCGRTEAAEVVLVGDAELMADALPVVPAMGRVLTPS